MKVNWKAIVGAAVFAVILFAAIGFYNRKTGANRTLVKIAQHQVATRAVVAAKSDAAAKHDAAVVKVAVADYRPARTRYKDERAALKVSDTAAVVSVLALADTALSKADSLANVASTAASSTVVAIANRDTLDAAKDTLQKATQALVPSLGQKIVTDSKWALVGGTVVVILYFVFHL